MISRNEEREIYREMRNVIQLEGCDCVMIRWVISGANKKLPFWNEKREKKLWITNRFWAFQKQFRVDRWKFLIKFLGVFSTSSNDRIPTVLLLYASHIFFVKLFWWKCEFLWVYQSNFSFIKYFANVDNDKLLLLLVELLRKIVWFQINLEPL